MFRWILVLAAVALAIGAAYGQSSSPSQPSLPLGQNYMTGMQGTTMGMNPNMPPMMQMHEAGMMDPDTMGQLCRGRMGMIGVEGSPESHLEARLAFVRSELGIDQAQEPAWQAYVAALRKETSTRWPRMHHAMAGGLDFPAELDARVTLLEGTLSSLKAVRDEAVALYAQLSKEQMRKADRLLAMSLCM